MKTQDLKNLVIGLESFDIEKDGKALLQQRSSEIQRLQKEGKTFEQICERFFLPELKKKYIQKLGLN